MLSQFLGNMVAQLSGPRWAWLEWLLMVITDVKSRAGLYYEQNSSSFGWMMVQQNFNEVFKILFGLLHFSFPLFCVCDWGGIRLRQSPQHTSQHMDEQKSPCIFSS